MLASENRIPSNKIGTASDLWAKAHGDINSGPYECHWCGSACNSKWQHDDPPPIPFTRSNTTAKRPGNAFICQGCWIWRRASVTVNFLSGGFKDHQTAKNHSWWVTPEGVWAIRKEDKGALYERLLKPPTVFFLSLKLDTGGVDNLLQLCVVNNMGGIIADTQLRYTLCNVMHIYTVYELEVAVREGPIGTEPGVQALLSRLGSVPSNVVIPPGEKRGRGRPKTVDIDEEESMPNKKVLVASGMVSKGMLK